MIVPVEAVALFCNWRDEKTLLRVHLKVADVYCSVQSPIECGECRPDAPDVTELRFRVSNAAFIEAHLTPEWTFEYGHPDTMRVPFEEPPGDPTQYGKCISACNDKGDLAAFMEIVRSGDNL